MTAFRATFRTAAAATALLGVLGLAAGASADDVRLTRGRNYSGTIVEYTGTTLALELANGNRVEFPADEVLSVRADLPAALDEADKRIAAGQAGDVLRALADVTDERAWVRQRIALKRLDALAALDRPVELTEAAAALAADYDGVDLLARLPVIWTPGTPPTAEQETAAERWLDGADPVLRLVAASWLLEGDDQGRALEVLRQLETAETRIGYFARAQPWRVRPVEGAETDVERLGTLLGKMPRSVRGGPQFVYAYALERQAQAVPAALAYLRTAYLYPVPAELRRAAVARAADGAEAAGLKDDAVKLRAELRKKTTADADDAGS